MEDGLSKLLQICNLFAPATVLSAPGGDFSAAVSCVTSPRALVPARNDFILCAQVVGPTVLFLSQAERWLLEASLPLKGLRPSPEVTGTIGDETVCNRVIWLRGWCS